MGKEGEQYEAKRVCEPNGNVKNAKPELRSDDQRRYPQSSLGLTATDSLEQRSMFRRCIYC